MKPEKGSHFLRKGRTSIKSQRYLITATVQERKPIFISPQIAEIVLESLHWLEKQEKIILDAAVVMPDHFHFVAALCDGSLSKIMHSLKSFTAKRINDLLNRQGRIWQPQYHDHAIRKEETLIDVVIYTLNNPVRAGLVKDFHDYPFWYCRWQV